MNITEKIEKYLEESTTTDYEEAYKLLIKHGFNFQKTSQDERIGLDKDIYYESSTFRHKNYPKVLFVLSTDRQQNLTDWEDFVGGPVDKGGHHYTEKSYKFGSPLKRLKEHLPKYYG